MISHSSAGCSQAACAHDGAAAVQRCNTTKMKPDLNECLFLEARHRRYFDCLERVSMVFSQLMLNLLYKLQGVSWPAHCRTNWTLMHRIFDGLVGDV